MYRPAILALCLVSIATVILSAVSVARSIDLSPTSGTLIGAWLLGPHLLAIGIASCSRDRLIHSVSAATGITAAAISGYLFFEFYWRGTDGLAGLGVIYFPTLHFLLVLSAWAAITVWSSEVRKSKWANQAPEGTP